MRLLSSVHGAPVGTVNNGGDTPAIVCAKSGFIIGLLLLRGEGVLPARKLRYGDVLDIDAENDEGLSALDIVAEDGDLDMADYLINNLGATATQRAKRIFIEDWNVMEGELLDVGFSSNDRPDTSGSVQS